MALRKLFLMAALVLGAAACESDISGVRIPSDYRVGGLQDTTMTVDSVTQARPHRKLDQQ